MAAAAATVAASLAVASPGLAAAAHTVAPGETLTSIAAVNGLTASELAAHNGLAADALLVTGTELEIPTPEPVTDPGAGDARSGESESPPAGPMPPWVTQIHHPSDAVYLDQGAAAAWEAMREESLREFGVDLYPRGELSGYRTYAQQAHLYERFEEGTGSRAAPPGSSSHEYGTALDLATPEMRSVIDQIGPQFGWQKVEAADEWWHVSYVGG